jgi:hypothetical protein
LYCLFGPVLSYILPAETSGDDVVAPTFRMALLAATHSSGPALDCGVGQLGLPKLIQLCYPKQIFHRYSIPQIFDYTTAFLIKNYAKMPSTIN